MASRQEAKRQRREAREAEERRIKAREQRRKRLGVVGLILAAVLGVAAVAAVAVTNSGDKTAADGGSVAGVRQVDASLDGISQSGMVLGDPKAEVRLIEYADLRCPACKMYADQALPQIIDKYVRSGRVALEFRHFPILGPDSQRAARVAASASRQNRMWHFLELFYANQGDERDQYVTDEFLRTLLTAAKLNPGEVLDGISDQQINNRVRRDTQQAQRLGATGTPFFTIKVGDGPERPHSPKSLDLDGFSSALDTALR